MIAAPCSCRVRPRRTAPSTLRQTLSRYHESGERLITPISEGRELNAKWRPLIENSLTWYLRQSQYLLVSAANCSRLSIVTLGVSRLLTARAGGTAPGVVQQAKVERL